MAIIHWKLGVSGDFATGINWIGNTAPTSGDTAALDAAGTYTVTTAADETVDNLTTIASARLAVAGGSPLLSRAAPARA
jgi:hypothetical protein